MKQKRHIIIKTLKWGAICIFGYLFLTTLIFGHTNLDTRTGVQSFGWSGLDALFSDQAFGLFINEPYKTKLKGVDGPYIFDNVKYEVNQKNELKKNTFDRRKPIKVHVRNQDEDKFEIILKNSYENEVANYDLPSRLIAISDIEGNFNALYSFLINNKVMDENYNWIFGDGHLVLNGDFFDRGKNVTQCLWLIYTLEKKAEDKHGKVHFINGNHEIMNLEGDISYSQHQYIEVAKQVSQKTNWEKAAKFMYSEKSELGKWLRTKNVIEKIGPYLFVHAGLTKRYIQEDLKIDEINKIARKYYGKSVTKTLSGSKEKLIINSQNSPYWDRSLATKTSYKLAFMLNGDSLIETSQTDLDSILKFYNAKKIVIGHSVVNDVSTDYNTKLIKIDVKHGLTKNSLKTRGILIENNKIFIINSLGEKKRLLS